MKTFYLIIKINLAIFLVALLSLLCVSVTNTTMHGMHGADIDFTQICINLHSSLTNQLSQLNQVFKLLITLVLLVSTIVVVHQVLLPVNLGKVKRITEQIFFSILKFLSWLSLFEKRSELSMG